MSRINKVLTLTICLLSPACRSTPVHTPPGAGAGSNDALLAVTDPSAGRLDDLRVALMDYWHAYGRMPGRIEDLRPFAEPGTTLQFTSPASGRPYVYMPAGPTLPGQGLGLVLYDPTPLPDGRRWGVLLARTAPNRPLITTIQLLDGPTLAAYLRSAAP
jgi:hypothetical protein